MSKKSDMIEKVKALLQKTVDNGCSEAEALTAAAMASRFISEYSITLDELELRETKCVSHEISLGDRHKSHEVNFVVVAIANYTGTKAWSPTKWVAVDGKNKKRRFLVFYGLPEDVIFAEYLTYMVKNVMELEWKAYSEKWRWDWVLNRVHGNTMRKAFLMPMANRLSARLNEMKRHESSELIEGKSVGALVVVKNAVVEEQFAEIAKALKLRNGTKSKYQRNRHAGAAGVAAADRVNLNRAITERSTTLRISSR